MQRVDLHCHSSVSDGLLAPAALVRRAAANGVQVLALTDHDDTAGLAEAREAAAEAGVRLVDGVEISITWEGTTLHVVGLGIRSTQPELAQGLAAIRAGRWGRAQRIASALARLGIDGAQEGAARQACGASIIGRTHFARFLMEQGITPDIQSAFDRYLTPGKPAYVEHRWAELADAVGWIRAAGGVAVLAHPGRYRVSSTARKRLFDQYVAVGGEAVEVVSGAHGRNQQRDFARVARHYGLLASVASDFHGPGESAHDVGSMPGLPEGLVPVWERFV